MKILIRPEETGFAVEMKCYLHLHFNQPYVFLKLFQRKTITQRLHKAAPLLPARHANNSQEM